jgi:site-specific DNA recombinase
MNSSFEKFAKGRNRDAVSTLEKNKCVIYTRVSTKEQAENNLSLETQRKACGAFASKFGYIILEYFGGTYESAKNDERHEFKRMLDFVKKSKEKISYIVVYSVDRFSRSGANAIFIASELKKSGVNVLSVTQPTDSSTASGSLQQNIQFIFSEYDNQMRREKCMAGTREKLSKGEWVTKAPLGYDHIKVNGQTNIVINEKGKLLRNAFLWKVNEGISNEEIKTRLAPLGLRLTHQKVSAVFKNPFYCGLLVHNLLEGKIIEGKHEKIISKDVFLQINDMQAKFHHQSHFNENEKIPLKRFLKCDNCGQYLRGYEVKKKKIYYYKCNTIGCNCNKNANQLHEAFLQLLEKYTLPEECFELMQCQLENTFNSLNQEVKENNGLVTKKLTEVNQKIETLEERFILGEIDKELYLKFVAKFKSEKQELDKQLQKQDITVSNLSEYINLSLNIASKLPSAWLSSNYAHKQKLQNLVFPEGIFYNRKNEECRTPRVNYIFSLIGSLSNTLDQQKSGINSSFRTNAALVPGTRIELVLPQWQQDFKSCVSTSSTTRAKHFNT